MEVYKMEDFFIRFLGIVEELDKNPNLEILNFSISDPVSEATINYIKKNLDNVLPPDLLSFFRESNGLQLRWIFKESPIFSEIERLGSDHFPFKFPLESYWIGTGCINIPSLESIFLDDWSELIYGDDKGEIFFENHTISLTEFNQSIRPFDIFSKDTSMNFSVSKDEKRCVLVLAQDHFADYESSVFTDLYSYLEFLLYSFGKIETRRKWYHYSTHQYERKMIETSKEFWANQPAISLY